jgi:hypothetical protein
MQKTYNAINKNQLSIKEITQNSNTSSWLLPLAAAFGVGFMLGGE